MVQFSNMRPAHPNYTKGGFGFFFFNSIPGFYILPCIVAYVPEILPGTHCPSFHFLPSSSSLFLLPQGSSNVVEAVPNMPSTSMVRSELTLEVSRSDDDAYITCVVDHASLAPGDKRTEQALRVLCE